MNGIFFGLNEIKFTKSWTTSIYNHIKKLTILETIMSSQERIWWLKIWKDIKSS